MHSILLALYLSTAGEVPRLPAAFEGRWELSAEHCAGTTPALVLGGQRIDYMWFNGRIDTVRIEEPRAVTVTVELHGEWGVRRETITYRLSPDLTVLTESRFGRMTAFVRCPPT